MQEGEGSGTLDSKVHDLLGLDDADLKRVLSHNIDEVQPVLLLYSDLPYNNCIGHQKNCPYIELSLIRSDTAARVLDSQLHCPYNEGVLILSVLIKRDYV